MGKSLGLTQLIVKVQAVIKTEQEIRDDIERAEKDLIDRLLSIQVTPSADSVNVAVGQSAKVTVKIRMPETITTDPLLRFEVGSNSGLKIKPNEVKLKDDATSAEFEVIAGTATGTHTLRIIPSQGKAVDLKVNVK
jgi:hypothetical protein